MVRHRHGLGSGREGKGATARCNGFLYAAADRFLTDGKMLAALQTRVEPGDLVGDDAVKMRAGVHVIVGSRIS